VAPRRFFRSPPKVGVFLVFKAKHDPNTKRAYLSLKGAKIAFVAQFAARGSQNRMLTVQCFYKEICNSLTSYKIIL
jgi:hypothetical protein